jgi:SpoVK/Ycf46/Vps4 family AAA+-type ATPase
MIGPWKLSTFVALTITGVSTALLVPSQWRQAHALRNSGSRLSSQNGAHSSSSPETRNTERNAVFIEGLMSNLSKLCDRYIMNGSPKTREQVFNVLDQIAAEAADRELVHQSIRMVKRAGVPMHKTYLEKFSSELGKNDASIRREDAVKRKTWEEEKQGLNSSREGKSALSRRMAGTDGRPDLFTPSLLDPDSIATVAGEKRELQKQMANNGTDSDEKVSRVAADEAASRVAEIIARAGSGASFEGDTIGVGGLDDVLSQIKRRIWTPLAAPPSLLQELGIHPARGLLLYGKPGCGKSLLASTLGSLLSPFRPITVVSGPEILDKFVGSSEKNLRDIFDNPPDIYDQFRLNEEDGGESIANAALHVVVMDEFDAVARSRGGSDGKGGQGDAGVARDSVVNQLLAKMDGVQPLAVPTLVIGLTNKRSLIEPALLRPGRFEVQIEIPPPTTNEQRVSILKVHTKRMYAAGRLQVNDPPPGTPAGRQIEKLEHSMPPTYEELLMKVASLSDGFSGAAIAGVARAAASRALERAVGQFLEGSDGSENVNMMDCLVTPKDFYAAVSDVRESMGNHDHIEKKPETDNADEALIE